ncbi:MAG: hypothetical protein AAB521_03730 [Patescibacteria group bacterium]
MEQRPGKPQMPTGEELAAGIQRKFIRDVLPALRESERYRNRSRRDLENSDVVFYPRPPRRVAAFKV